MRRVELIEGPGIESLARRLREAVTDIEVTVTGHPTDDSVIIARELDPELERRARQQPVITFSSETKPDSYWLLRDVEVVDPDSFEGLVARAVRESRRDVRRASQMDGPPNVAEMDLEGLRAPMQPLRLVQATFQLVSQFCLDAAIAYYEYSGSDRLLLFAQSEPGALPQEIDRVLLPPNAVGVLSPGTCPICRDRELVHVEEDHICLVAPVASNTRHYGVLIVLERDAGATPLDREQAVQNSARQLAVALESAHLFGQVRSAYSRLREAKDQLVHAEKFAAVGVLAAEIAHEINNPASFVITNLSVLGDYAKTIASFHSAVRSAAINGLDAAGLAELEEEHEIGWLEEDIEVLIRRSLSGLERIHQIVQDLRFTSHARSTSSGWVNVERLIESALGLVRHEAKFRAEIVLDFAGLPMVKSDPNRLSQVFLNLLVNAVQSIESGNVEGNAVRVSTRVEDGFVVVSVHDTGSGINPEELDEIFEPFFTTKEPGDGTGLGLSISRDIVRGLGGDISVESEPGAGSVFTVRIPTSSDP